LNRSMRRRWKVVGIKRHHVWVEWWHNR
jgi:hypothetical protein